LSDCRENGSSDEGERLQVTACDEHIEVPFDGFGDRAADGDAELCAAPLDRLSAEELEQRLRLLQVLCIEAFGEPAVDGGEKVASLVSAPLGAQ
jgi:hypothetical protein